MEPRRLVARDLADPQPRFSRADVDESLDLEAVAVDVDVDEAAPPEGVVPVAQIGEARAVERVDEDVERLIS